MSMHYFYDTRKGKPNIMCWKEEGKPSLDNRRDFLHLNFWLSFFRNDCEQPLSVLPQQTHLSPYGSGRDSPNAAAGPGLWSGHCVLWGKGLLIFPESSSTGAASASVGGSGQESEEAEWAPPSQVLTEGSRTQTCRSPVSPAEDQEPGQHRGIVGHLAQVARWASCQVTAVAPIGVNTHSVHEWVLKIRKRRKRTRFRPGKLDGVAFGNHRIFWWQ